MIDTMTMFLHAHEAPDYSKKVAIKQLERVRFHADDNHNWYSGYAGSLYVNAMDRGIMIKGSLPGFYFGNNFHSLSISDTRKAFEKLESTINYSLSAGIITSVDIFQNIELNHPPGMYLSLFGKSRRTEPERWKDTVYYENQSIKKTFYDKGLQMAGSKSAPAGITGKNILRYELRYKKGFRARFGNITPAGLVDPDVRKRIMDHWEKEYQSIEKYNKMKLDYSKAKTPGEWKDIHFANKILEDEIDQVLKTIDQGKMNRKGRYRARKIVMDIIKTKDQTEHPELLEELDAKIKDAAESILSEN